LGRPGEHGFGTVSADRNALLQDEIKREKTDHVAMHNGAALKKANN
jgi:hypothetical protein